MKQLGYTWLYYKLYVGQYYKQLDYLVSEATKEVTSHEDVLSWFYIRYFDEGGIHLRLRIKVKEENAKSLDMKFYRQLHDHCNTLVDQPEPTFTPLVSLPEHEEQMNHFAGLVVIKREKYEPEVDIYGENMEAAEDLFKESSEIAREVINLEASSAGLSRKDIVTRLMFEALTVFKPSDSVSSFLESYSNYWLAGSTELGNYKSTFEDKAYDLIDDGVPIIKPLSAYPQQFEAVLLGWKNALEVALSKYKKHSYFNTALNDRVLFYFVHLMNNRLGFTTIDEAYIAILLKSALLREDTNEVA